MHRCVRSLDWPRPRPNVRDLPFRSHRLQPVVRRRSGEGDEGDRSEADEHAKARPGEHV